MSLIQKMRKHHKIADDVRLGIKGVETEYDASDNDGNVFWCTANTARIDSDDEVVVPEGCVLGANGMPDYFGTFKTIYLNHDYDKPVGTMRSVSLRKGRGWRVKFYITDGTELGRETLVMLKEGIIRGTSIGFIALDYGPPTDDDVGQYGPARSVVRSWKWLEHSVTAMPCNQDAEIDQPGILSSDAMKGLEIAVTKGWVSRSTAASMGWRPSRKTVVLAPERKIVTLN